MSVIRVGSNEKYASGWDKAFGAGKKVVKKKTAKSAKKKAAPKKKAKASPKKKAKK